MGLFSFNVFTVALGAEKFSSKLKKIFGSSKFYLLESRYVYRHDSIITCIIGATLKAS